MTVAEVIEALMAFPPDMEVHISDAQWGSTPVDEVRSASVNVDAFAARVLPDGTKYTVRLRKPRKVDAVLIKGVI